MGSNHGYSTLERGTITSRRFWNQGHIFISGKLGCSQLGSLATAWRHPLFSMQCTQPTPVDFDQLESPKSSRAILPHMNSTATWDTSSHQFLSSSVEAGLCVPGGLQTHRRQLESVGDWGAKVLLCWTLPGFVNPKKGQLRTGPNLGDF